ncbi:MAG: ABC transporter ATP-binding protein [Candidatus Daviesbacteria bacterium]|nr:ABC transporter ATP-binding protein [Candidatus Daviesbacteria bacterium]
MFKFNYSGKIGKLKQTVATSIRLLGLLWSIDRWLLSINILVMIIPALIPFAFAYIFKMLIDQVVLAVAVGKVNLNMITMLFVAGFVVYTVQSIAFSVQDYLHRLLYTKIPISLYQIVLNKISSLDVAYFEDSKFKNTLEKVRDAYYWRPLNMMDYLLFSFQSLIQVVASIIILSTLAPILVLVILVVAIPELISRIQESQLGWGIWDSQSPHRKKFWYISSLLQERDSVKEMKLFGLPKRFLSEIKGIQENIYQENKSLATKYLGINSLFNVLEGMTFVAVLLFTIFQAIAKTISVGDISYYTTVITNLQNGIGGLFRNIVRLFSESLYVSSIFEVLDAESKIIETDKPVKLSGKMSPKIEFKDVFFTYAGAKKPTLKNFNLTINPGEKVALIGENGAGKTTIVKLLARFYDVDSGEILINGINIKSLDLNDWYQHFGVLFQDFVKYEYPVKENIYFGKIFDKEDMGKIIEAAISSGADPMVRNLEHGYEQMLGRTFEDGVELSAGQWQKIALARGFLRDAQVLVLDEPTASIDAKAESEIFGRVEKLSKDKTVIIISHRFSTVRNADKIYVIENGKISESGTHEDLMKLSGQYATLFNLQAKGYR